MADDIHVTGAEDFLALSKRLKAAGNTELRRELHKAVRKAARPITPATKQAAKRILPRRGGLAGVVARAPQRTQARTGQETAGVRIVVGGKGGAPRMTDQGFVRHPVFGDMDVWVRQSVPSGWFSGTAQGLAPKIRRDVVDVLDDFAERTTHG